MMGIRRGVVLASLCLAAPSLSVSAQGAERISVTTGAFLRSIEVSEIESWVETGDPGSLGSLFRLAGVDQDKLREQLSAEIDLDVVAADKILNSKPGNELLLQIGTAVKAYRNAPPEISAKAIRAALILSLADGPTSALKILRAYPTDQILVDLTKIGGISIELSL